MKFKLTLLYHVVKDPAKREEYESLGFSFEPHKDKDGRLQTRMSLTKMPSIELSTIDQLCRMSNKYGPIIFSSNQITIMNDPTDP